MTTHKKPDQDGKSDSRPPAVKKPETPKKSPFGPDARSLSYEKTYRLFHDADGQDPSPFSTPVEPASQAPTDLNPKAGTGNAMLAHERNISTERLGISKLIVYDEFPSEPSSPDILSFNDPYTLKKYIYRKPPIPNPSYSLNPLLSPPYDYRNNLGVDEKMANFFLVSLLDVGKPVELIESVPRSVQKEYDGCTMVLASGRCRKLVTGQDGKVVAEKPSGSEILHFLTDVLAAAQADPKIEAFVKSNDFLPEKKNL